MRATKKQRDIRPILFDDEHGEGTLDGYVPVPERTSGDTVVNGYAGPKTLGLVLVNSPEVRAYVLETLARAERSGAGTFTLAARVDRGRKRLVCHVG